MFERDVDVQSEGSRRVAQVDGRLDQLCFGSDPARSHPGPGVRPQFGHEFRYRPGGDTSGERIDRPGGVTPMTQGDECESGERHLEREQHVGCQRADIPAVAQRRGGQLALVQPGDQVGEREATSRDQGIGVRANHDNYVVINLSYAKAACDARGGRGGVSDQRSFVSSLRSSSSPFSPSRATVAGVDRLDNLEALLETAPPRPGQGEVELAPVLGIAGPGDVALGLEIADEPQHPR